MSGSKVEQPLQVGVQRTMEDMKEAGESRMNKKKENLKLTGIEPATDGWQPKVVGIRRSTNWTTAPDELFEKDPLLTMNNCGNASTSTCKASGKSSVFDNFNNILIPVAISQNVQ